MQALFAGKAQSSQSKPCPRKRNRNQKPCFLPVERVSTHPTFSALQIPSYALSSQLPPFLTYNEPSSAAPAGVPCAFLYCNPISVCRAQLLSFRKGLRKEPGANYREAPACLLSCASTPGRVAEWCMGCHIPTPTSKYLELSKLSSSGQSFPQDPQSSVSGKTTWFSAPRSSFLSSDHILLLHWTVLQKLPSFCFHM